MDLSLYFFLALYAVLLFFLCVLFFPEEMADYNGFKDYFYSRRRWIFSLMIVLFIADLADTLIKGREYLHALGPLYYLRTAVCLLLSAVAVKTSDARFHAVFAMLATVLELAFILKAYLAVT